MSEDVLRDIDNDARNATIVVGNTVNGDRARFNCHLVDDIQAGIDLLPASGGKLLIKRGQYNPAAALNAIPNNSIIEGEDNVQINKPVGLNIFEIDSGENNITIKNILVLNGGGDLTGGHLIQIDRGSDIKIIDCGFFNNPGENAVVEGDGIHIEGFAPDTSEGVVIVRCFFDTCGRGIYAESTDPDTVTVSDVSIIDCELIDTLREAIYLLLTERCTIENTRVLTAGFDGTFDGILIQGRDTDNRSSGHRLNSVWIFDATGNGIALEWVDRSSLTQIHAETSTLDGVFLVDCDNNVVSASVSYSNTLWGINVSNDGSGDNIITSNQLPNNGSGGLQDVGTGTESGHNIIA